MSRCCTYSEASLPSFGMMGGRSIEPGYYNGGETIEVIWQMPPCLLSAAMYLIIILLAGEHWRRRVTSLWPGDIAENIGGHGDAGMRVWAYVGSAARNAKSF